MVGTPHNHMNYACMATMDEPISFIETLQKEDVENWKAATNEEYKSLMKNNTYKFTEFPQRRKAIVANGYSELNERQMGRLTNITCD
jgi:hypothetical protein